MNLSVYCEYKDRGCKRLVCLREMGVYRVDCDYRFVFCINDGCKLVFSFREMEKYVIGDCLYKEVGVCFKGCSLVLL